MGCCDATTPICQSCAMPLSAPEDCGTLADGSYSPEFCRHCYQAGGFTADLTQEQMVDKLVGFAEHMGMTEAQARAVAAEVLPTLKRWKDAA